MENWENIKAYIKSGIREPMLRGDLICADVLICMFGIVPAIAGLTHSSMTEYPALIVFGLSIFSILYGIISTINLNTKKYIRFYAVFSVLLTLIFTIDGYILFIIQQNSYAELTCLIPVLVFLLTIVRTNFRIKKKVDINRINSKMELTASACALGVLCSRIFLKGNASFTEFMNHNAGYLLIFLACVFATNALNFVKWYYIKKLEKQGNSIE